jgi:hypothetical protein
MTYRGLCKGGPLDGQWLKYPARTHAMTGGCYFYEMNGVWGWVAAR